MVGVRRSGPALEQVHPVDTGAEVLPERLLARHEQDMTVSAGVDLVTDAFAHPGGAWRPPDVVVTGVAGDLVLGALVGAPGLAAVPVERGRAVGLRQLEIG